MITEVGMMVGLLSAAIRTEYLKSQQMELSDEVRNVIEQEGLYHITTKEAAEKIMESGYLLPSKGLADNHFSKSRYGDGFSEFAYMFAGKPTAEMYKVNLSHRTCPDGTIYAVRYKPDKFDIENYTERLEDGAITHEGILDIANSKPELVRMKFEKDQLVEIPWDEPVKTSFLRDLKENSIVKFWRSLPSAARELGRNVKFVDRQGKLARSKAIRKEQRKMIEQYENDAENRSYHVGKDGGDYSIIATGAKMNDGKILNGFRVVKEGTDFQKNIFTDGFNLSEMTPDEMSNYFSEHVDFEAEHSEYIGKPIKVNGEVVQSLDSEYMHHFNQKQARIAENNSLYVKYLADQEKKKITQFKKFGQAFKAVSARKRNDLLEVLKYAKEKGLHPEELTMDNTKQMEDAYVL